MRRIALFIFILFISFNIYAQTNAEKFFPKEDLISVGAYYYPEQWPEKDWEDNIKQMSSMGFTFTHIGEFAWHRMEPEEGKYDFLWLDKVLNLCGKYNLKVILCTPSATPPTWMLRKYPEVSIMNDNQLRRDQGGRRHGNVSSQIFMAYVDKIVTQLAKKYGNDPRVMGWQIDNEPHYENMLDYSHEARQAFISWLEKKYTNDISKLNNAWGNSFWSQTYNAFSEINLPNPKANGVNHHHLLDFQLFNADQIAYLLNYQADILKKYISKSQWVTTNYAYYKFLAEVDPFLTRKKLDFASYTMYPMSTWLEYDKGNMAYRLGSGLEMSFSSELTKSQTGYTGIMELQPGQINWGSYNAIPQPGVIKMWMYHNFALGSKFICTYRFRQPVFGGEMYHKGIMETDGKTISPGGKEYVEFMKELEILRKEKDTRQTIPEAYEAKRVGILWSTANLLDVKNNPHVNRWDPYAGYYNWYQSVKSSVAPVTFLQDSDDFSPKKYPFLILPVYQSISNTLLAKITKYAEDGGHLILTTRSGTKDSLFHLQKGLPGVAISNLIGARILYFDQLPDSKSYKVEIDKQNYEWNIQADVLEPFSGTEVWGNHLKNENSEVLIEPFYFDKAAITHRKLKRGSVTYVGAISNNRNIETKVFSKLLSTYGKSPENLPPYVFKEWRDGYWIAVNYSSSIYEIPKKVNQKFIFGKEKLLPGQYSVWKE